MILLEPMEANSPRTSPDGGVCFARSLAPGDSVRLAVNAMGTRFELFILGQDEPQLRAAGEAALEEILTLHRRLSAFERSSELARVNREAGRGWSAISADMIDLLDLCARAHELSAGAFDPTVGPLMEAWGFRGGTPDVSAARTARERVGMDKVELDRERGRVRFNHPQMQLDLGGVAKGFALDRAAETLRDGGVESALLHGGTSSAIAIGSPANEAGWRVRIGVQTGGPVVVLRDAALGVSAPHGRMIEHEGRQLGHVIDPRTGEPARGAASAFVVGTSGAMCDALSTALLVAQQWTDSMLGESLAMGVERDDSGWEWTERDAVIEWPATSGRSSER